MAVKSSSVGPFTIPTAPSAGTSVAQNASANTYTASYVQSIASTVAALFITGIGVSLASTSKPTYINVQIATGTAGSETIIGQIQLSGFSTAGATGQQIGMTIPIWPPIPVAASTRIALKTASDVASALAWNVSLQCVAQANVVAEGSINETVNVIQVNGTAQTARDVGAQLDATVSSRMATYSQPTGFLAATFPTSVASPTNITAGVITTATNLTNLPAIPANWLTATGIAASALNGKGDWNIGKTGYAISSTGLALQTAWTVALTGNITGNLSGSVGSVSGAVGSVTGNIGGLTAAGWAGAFTTNSGKVYTDAISGSVVKEIVSNASGGGGGSPWDALLADHHITGTFGQRLRALIPS